MPAIDFVYTVLTKHLLATFAAEQVSQLSGQRCLSLGALKTLKDVLPFT